MTMNAIPDNRVVSHQTRTGTISTAGKAAHLAATNPVLGHKGKARIQDEIEDAYAERARQLADAVAHETAASSDEDDGNWLPKANWLPSLVPAPMPRRTIPADVIEGMWDTVMDGYSLTSAA